MIKWFALCAVLILSVGAKAQVNGGYVGYQYPKPNSLCSPVCTGVSASLKIPTVTAVSSATYYAWIGIATLTGDGSIINSTGLGQFGVVYQTGPGWRIWWELFCGHGGSGCGAPLGITGFTLSPGDTVSMLMVCTVACNATTPEQWTVKFTDTTTGAVCYMHGGSSTCGSSSDTFNWPLSANNAAYVVFEPYDIQSWPAPAQWSNVMYATGLPGSQVWHNMPLTPSQNLFATGNAGASNETFSASGPLGANQNDFNICSPIVSTIFNPCSVSPYSAAPAMGPSL
jgi:hypothetical protein